MNEELYVIAKYDYAPQNEKELAIKKNEKLILLDDSKQWWKVENNQHQSGIVPSNFVKKYKPSIFASLRNTLGRRKGLTISSALSTLPSGSNNKKCTGDSDLASEMMLEGGNMTITIAKYPYTAAQPDELKLLKGDKVVVIEKSSDGWWKGYKVSTKEIGWFPSNYMELPETTMNNTYSSTSAVKSPQANNNTDSVNLTSDITIDNSRLADKCIETVATLYPFSSTNKEELSFQKDETLEILEKSPLDPDWWKARNRKGDVGLVPRNYVRTLLSTDSGCPQTTPESSQSNSSLSGQSHGGGQSNSRTPSGAGRSGTGSRSFPNPPGGPYTTRPWYLGSISRLECEKLLNSCGENGDFIIRDSESNVSFTQHLFHSFFILLPFFFHSCSFLFSHFCLFLFFSFLLIPFFFHSCFSPFPAHNLNHNFTGWRLHSFPQGLGSEQALSHHG